MTRTSASNSTHPPPPPMDILFLLFLGTSMTSIFWLLHFFFFSSAPVDNARAVIFGWIDLGINIIILVIGIRVIIREKNRETIRWCWRNLLSFVSVIVAGTTRRNTTSNSASESALVPTSNPPPRSLFSEARAVVAAQTEIERHQQQQRTDLIRRRVRAYIVNRSPGSGISAYATPLPPVAMASDLPVVPFVTATFAPIVATALPDNFVTNLVTENEKLRKESKKKDADRLRIVISGRGGTAEYCETSMANGSTVNGPDGLQWVVLFNQSDDDDTDSTFPNFIMDTNKKGLELRLGGVVVFPFNAARFYISLEEGKVAFERSRETPQMGRVRFEIDNNGSNIVAAVFGRFGPIGYDQYQNLYTTTSTTPGTGECSTYNMETVLMLTRLCLKIDKVVFNKSKISGILSL